MRKHKISSSEVARDASSSDLSIPKATPEQSGNFGNFTFFTQHKFFFLTSNLLDDYHTYGASSFLIQDNVAHCVSGICLVSRKLKCLQLLLPLEVYNMIISIKNEALMYVSGGGSCICHVLHSQRNMALDLITMCCPIAGLCFQQVQELSDSKIYSTPSAIMCNERCCPIEVWNGYERASCTTYTYDGIKYDCAGH